MATIVHRNAVPAATVASFASVVGAIPGCLLTSLDLVTSDAKPNARPSLRAVLHGWSPSLHYVQIRCTSLIPKDWTVSDLGHPDFMDVATRMFAAKLAIQRVRSEAGITVGAPLPIVLRHNRTARIDHMHADRAALTLALRDPRSTPGMSSTTFAQVLRGMVEGAHLHGKVYNGGARLEGNANAIEEVREGDATLRTVRVPVRPGGTLSMWGPHLQMRGPDLPDTVLLAASGRRLGEVVEVEPVLAGRIILTAGRGSIPGQHMLWFDLADDLVTLRHVADDVSDERLQSIFAEGMPA
jgi:hypothetical protein